MIYFKFDFPAPSQPWDVPAGIHAEGVPVKHEYRSG